MLPLSPVPSTKKNDLMLELHHWTTITDNLLIRYIIAKREMFRWDIEMKTPAKHWVFKDEPFPTSVSLSFVIFDLQLVENVYSNLWDSISGSLISGATTLPTEPPPLPSYWSSNTERKGKRIKMNIDPVTSWQWQRQSSSQLPNPSANKLFNFRPKLLITPEFPKKIRRQLPNLVPGLFRRHFLSTAHNFIIDISS